LKQQNSQIKDVNKKKEDTGKEEHKHQKTA
jgi:hypothetical protein